MSICRKLEIQSEREQRRMFCLDGLVHNISLYENPRHPLPLFCLYEQNSPLHQERSALLFAHSLWVRERPTEAMNAKE